MARRRLSELLRPAESDALIAAVTRARDRLILLVGIGAGLRVSEMVRLRIEHVDTAASTVFVSQGKREERLLRCNPPLALRCAAAVDRQAVHRMGIPLPTQRGPANHHARGAIHG
jgi:integrase